MQKAKDTPRQKTDVVVLGGGAAGLMCAAVAGARGRRVRVLEKTARCGKKILMSGGGRCNFTNLDTEPRHFLSANPHYCKSALARYAPTEFLALVESHGIAWHEKAPGQLFCDHSAKDILQMLLRECADANVMIETEAAVEQVGCAPDGGFVVEYAGGPLGCESLVVATGGLSIPKMGGSGFGMTLARQFGLGVRATRAGLVPLLSDPADRKRHADLAGVSVSVETRCADAAFDAGLLFTHRGLSGPAVLQISSYWQEGDDIAIDWFAGADADAWLAERTSERPMARLSSVLAERLPKRLATYLCSHDAPQSLGDARLKQLDPARRCEIVERLCDWHFKPHATEGYKTAEVMLGGVDTNALDSGTMAARKMPGLYFIGEVVDVTGHLGGHNFQWAWASGQAAGQVV